MNQSENNQEDIKHKKRVKALYILISLIFSALLVLLGIHAVIVGSGSLLYDISAYIFISLAGIAMFSGIIFPLFAILIIPLIPFIIAYFYFKNN